MRQQTDDENHPDNETMIQQTDNKTADIQWDHRQTMEHQTDKTKTQQTDNAKIERQ